METPPARACPYLPNREATLRGFAVGRLPGSLYHEFLNAGFRRTGKVIYQPVCRGCRMCVPIRIPVAEFVPTKSLRRCRRRNSDLHVAVDAPRLTDEKTALYRSYIAQRHQRPPSETEDDDSPQEFLYRSPVRTVEFTYRIGDGGPLVAVGICDACPQSISSVYFYFDPNESRRSLGNFGALVEIDYARRLRIPYWYLGYWVKGCRAMEYKANFRPHELLHPDGVWRREN
jgi:arginine-tRNA-protein transferase